MTILDHFRPPFWARRETSNGKYHFFELVFDPQWGECLRSLCKRFVNFPEWEEQEDLEVVSEIDIYPDEKCLSCVGAYYTRVI